MKAQARTETETEQQTGTSLIQLGVTDQALAKLREKYAEVPDVKTKPGYELAKVAIKELRGYWVAVGKEATVQKEAALAHQRAVNAEQERIVGALKEIAEPIIDAKKEVDEAEKREKERLANIEKQRIDKIKSRIDQVRNLGATHNLTNIEHAEKRLADLNKYTVDDSYEEFQEQAVGVLLTAKKAVEDYLMSRKTFEAEQKEQKRRAEELEKRENEQRRIAEIQARINKIKMLPADLIGASVTVIDKTIGRLNATVVDESFGEFGDEANAAVIDAKGKLLAMLENQKAAERQQDEMAEQQRKMQEQQAELDRQKREQEQREAKERERKAAEEKAARDAELAEQNKAALAARLPEDQKMREYIKAVCSVPAPDVENPDMVVLLRDVSLALADIAQHVADNTQSVY